MTSGSLLGYPQKLATVAPELCAHQRECSIFTLQKTCRLRDTGFCILDYFIQHVWAYCVCCPPKTSFAIETSCLTSTFFKYIHSRTYYYYSPSWPVPHDPYILTYQCILSGDTSDTGLESSPATHYLARMEPCPFSSFFVVFFFFFFCVCFARLPLVFEYHAYHSN